MITATCFGGPLHGEVRTVEHARLVVAIPKHGLGLLMDESTPITALSFRQGYYDRERFGYRTKMGGVFLWDALLWSGGWYQDRPIKDYVADALNICGFLALLFCCFA